jgi:hypothetical protein
VPVEPFERRTHAQCLDELTAWVADGKPFLSLRITDGELWSMFRYRPETDTTADGNEMRYDLGEAIREIIRDYARLLQTEPDCRVQIGTTMFQHPDETTKWLAGYVWSLGAAEKFRWINGHDMLDGLIDGRTRKLFETLQTSGRRVILCCDRAIVETRYCCLGGRPCDFYPVPKPNAWLHRHSIRDGLFQFADGGFTFLWCTGMGTKPLAWQLFREYPQSSHLDCGHIFDGAFGIMSREWLRNREEPWWTPYMREGGFKDWVRSFIP